VHQKQRGLAGKSLREVTNILSEIFRPTADAKYSRNENFVAWCIKHGISNPMLDQPALTGLKNRKGTRELNLLSNEDFVARNIEIITLFLGDCIDPTAKNTLALDLRNLLQTSYYFKNYALAATFYTNFAMPFQAIIATLSFAELATFSLEWFGHVRSLVSGYVSVEGGGAKSVSADSLALGVDTFRMLGPVLGYFEYLPGLAIPDLPNISVSRKDTRIDWHAFKKLKADKRHEVLRLHQEEDGKSKWKKYNESITMKFEGGPSGISLCENEDVVDKIEIDSTASKMGVQIGWKVECIELLRSDIESSENVTFDNMDTEGKSEDTNVGTELRIAEETESPYSITFDQQKLPKSRRDEEEYNSEDYVPVHRIRLDACTDVERSIWITRVLMGIAIAYFSAQDFANVMKAVFGYTAKPFVRNGHAFPHIAKMHLKATQADFICFAQTFFLTYIEIYNHMEHRLSDYIGDEAAFAAFALGLASILHHLLDRCGARGVNDIAESMIGTAAWLFLKIGKMSPALLEKLTIQRRNKSFANICDDDEWYERLLQEVGDLNLRKEMRQWRALEKIRMNRKGSYNAKKATSAKKQQEKRRKDVIEAQKKNVVFSMDELYEFLASIDRTDKSVAVCNRLKLEVLKDHVRFFKLLYRDRKIAGTKPPRLAQTGLTAQEIQKLLIPAMPYVRKILRRDLPSSELLEREETSDGLITCKFLTSDKQIFRVKLNKLELARLGFV